MACFQLCVRFCPAVVCFQVVVFGGQAFNASASQVRLSTMLYVLDFSSSTPRWRAAQIRLNNQGAFQFGYPNTGVVLLPEFGAVALKHRSVSGSGAVGGAGELVTKPTIGHKHAMCCWLKRQEM